MKKQFIGTCVSNPFSSVDELCEIIDNARDITKATFLRRCLVAPEMCRAFTQYPRDFQFAKNKSIYFYTWSCIEHFFI